MTRRIRKSTPLMFLAAGVFGLAVASCIQLNQDSGSTGGGGSGGRTGCDAQPTCSECSQCAAMGKCASIVSACETDTACSALDQCIGLCGTDTGCKQQCVDNNADGVQGYNAAFSCLYCTECPHACSGYATCP